ncbi:MAG: rod shape-determining protein MreD [Oscillospiraceae bacterium]|nr:rod shape-determining protein MreD [Oscillospiraceae bacterium]
MRKLKIILWIFIVLLIQTVVISQLRIPGAVPSLVLVYTICVMIMENEFRNAVIISIICAVCFGALCDRGFVPTSLFYVYSSIVVFALRKKPQYVRNPIKAFAWVFIASGASEIMYFILNTFTINIDMLTNHALPTAVCNTVLAFIVYPLLRITMYREEKKKTLLVV